MPNPSWLETMGQGAAGQATGGFLNEGMGLLFAGAKRRQQVKTAKELQALQMQGQKEMTEYNFQKQLEMWNATGYGAQMDQMKKAGLNPGLMYGMGGGGGQTTNVETGNVGGQAAQVPQATHGNEGMGIQAALAKAQIENMAANTEKTKVEAEKMATVDTELTKTQTESLTQGIKNQKAVEALTQVQKEIAQVEASVSRQTINEQMKHWENIVAKGAAEIKQLGISNDLDEKSVKDKLELLKQEAIGAYLKNVLTKAQTTNVKQDTKNKIQEILESDARIKALSNQIAIAWDRLGMDSEKWTVERMDNMMRDDDFDFLKDIGGGASIFIPVGGIMRAATTPMRNPIGFK